MTVKRLSDLPGDGPDTAYHGGVRRWWMELGNPWFPGQAPPHVEAAYLNSQESRQASEEPKV
jgi:hypothetical protein